MYNAFFSSKNAIFAQSKVIGKKFLKKILGMAQIHMSILQFSAHPSDHSVSHSSLKWHMQFKHLVLCNSKQAFFENPSPVLVKKREIFMFTSIAIFFFQSTRISKKNAWTYTKNM